MVQIGIIVNYLIASELFVIPKVKPLRNSVSIVYIEVNTQMSSSKALNVALQGCVI